jgi:poly(A) polymerase
VTDASLPPAATPDWTLPTAAWLIRAETQAVFLAIEAAGYQVRAVGGAVRNTLLERPVADVDMATTARPEQVMAAARAAGLHVIPTGLQHGTVTVISGGIPHEVTTLRADIATDGRHATVAFTDDWVADASRRDLTINALYCNRSGRVFDPLGGRADVEARRVRFIGDPAERIREDYLRCLRFYRFHAEYASSDLVPSDPAPPDAEGVAATIKERAGLARLSGERIHHELRRLLVAPGAVAAVATLAEVGLLTELLGIVPRVRTLQRLVAIERAQGLSPNASLRLAALTIGVAEDAERLNRRLKPSAADRGILERAAERIGIVTDLSEAALQRRLYALGPTTYGQDILLAWADSQAAPVDAAWSVALTLPGRWAVPKLPVGGADVIGLGVPPGPQIGRIIAAFEAWWVDAGFPVEPGLLARRLSEIGAEITHVN